MKLNRSDRAIRELQAAGGRGLLSCELTQRIKVDFVGRAIEEARRRGYIISGQLEAHRASYGTHHEMRYIYGENNAQESKRIVRYEFVGNSAIPIYA